MILQSRTSKGIGKLEVTWFGCKLERNGGNPSGVSWSHHVEAKLKFSVEFQFWLSFSLERVCY